MNLAQTTSSALKSYIEHKLSLIYQHNNYVCNFTWDVSNLSKTYVQSKHCMGPTWVVESCFEPDSNKEYEEDCMYVLIHKVDSNNTIYDTLRFETPIEAALALEWLISGGF